MDDVHPSTQRVQLRSSYDNGSTVRFLVRSLEFIFCNPILLATCTSTFSKLCKNMYTVACRRVFSSALCN
jgi:hypothetical protein